MDIFYRAIAIFIEVIILTAVIYSLLKGVELSIFDMGIKAGYRKIVGMALIVLGLATVLFFIAHLTSFYPTL